MSEWLGAWRIEHVETNNVNEAVIDVVHEAEGYMAELCADGFWPSEDSFDDLRRGAIRAVEHRKDWHPYASGYYVGMLWHGYPPGRDKSHKDRWVLRDERGDVRCKSISFAYICNAAYRYGFRVYWH